jgi:hypothetical protein
MSNRLLTELWGPKVNFAGMVRCLDNEPEGPEIKTFFSRYRNPIGIEVECEGVQEDFGGKLVYWVAKPDGSLRDGGLEFVSHPLSGRLIDLGLHELQQVLTKLKALSWSHRTSIHVHQNFSTLREQHLMAYVMVYGLFEDLFYSLVSPLRSGNPFCYKATSIEPGEFQGIHASNKYCGFNLAPLKTQGTVEFRQLHGNSDFKLIRRWIQLIVKLHAWVEKQDSSKIVSIVQQHIAAGSFFALAKDIWGVNATLFTTEQIEDSCRKHAIWSLCIATREFR